jgi:predicted NBD/HSP70 family sugar kinase
LSQHQSQINQPFVQRKQHVAAQKDRTMGEKADGELVKRQNRGIVLEVLRRSGPLARSELGRMTGLSLAAITSITAQLMDDDVVLELGGPAQVLPTLKRGRPLVRLTLNPAAAMIVGVKIAIDDFELVVSDFAGRILFEKTLHHSTYSLSALEFGATLAEAIRVFLQENAIDKRQVSRIGVAVQGLADTNKGTIPWSPIIGARNIPVTSLIEELLGIPCSIANDANMIAEGLTTPDHKGVIATIFTGYGVGMGLIIDGKVFHGATGSASEFGHMNHIPHGALCRCGKRGCVEAYASDYGILRLVDGSNLSAPLPSIAVPKGTMEALHNRAARGDPLVIQAFEKAGEALGFGIARLISILNPDRIVIAGPGAASARYIEPAMRLALQEGVVEELLRGVHIEYVKFEGDMIIKGLLASLLRTMDCDVFAAGPIGEYRAEVRGGQ